MDARDVVEHLQFTKPADRCAEAVWLVSFLNPNSEGWATAKAECLRLLDLTDKKDATA